MKSFTSNDEIRARGVGVDLDQSAAAKMIEFHQITQDRQCAVIKEQALELFRQHRRMQRLELGLFSAIFVATIALADNLGWLK